MAFSCQASSSSLPAATSSLASGLPVGSLLQQQFLLSVVLIVVAYLLGSLLRSFAADDVDRKSGDYQFGAWREKRQTRGESTSPPEFATGREGLG